MRKPSLKKSNSTLLGSIGHLVCLLVLQGCTALSETHAPIEPIESNQIKLIAKDTVEADLATSSNEGWWRIGFHRHLINDNDNNGVSGNGDEANNELKPIQWHYDTYIAQKIAKPIIDSRSEIKLWRFHRRAANDKTGHKFSFIFYATRQVGEQVYQQINDHPLVKQLLAESHIDRLSVYGINGKLKANLADTSDKNWPKELQKSWPYFIMGVSQTWLSLVDFYYQALDMEDDANLDDQLEGFRQVSNNVDAIWKHSGNHAFLHHLNALFAYQELYILERRLGRF